MPVGLIITLVSVAGTVFGIVFGYVGYQQGVKKDSTEHGKNNGVLLSDVGYIKSGVDDLKRKQEKADERHLELVKDITRIESSAIQAHKRLDEHIHTKQENH